MSDRREFLVAGMTAMAASLITARDTNAAPSAKQLVQRDAPDANRGRSFAAFEVRFQMVWVIGAVIPVLISIPLRAGFLVIAAAAGFALVSYVAGQRAAHRAHTAPPDDVPDVLKIDQAQLHKHLDKIVRDSVEETLNDLLDAEADRLCGAKRYR